jgi:hypothetical protein
MPSCCAGLLAQAHQPATASAAQPNSDIKTGHAYTCPTAPCMHCHTLQRCACKIQPGRTPSGAPSCTPPTNTLIPAEHTTSRLPTWCLCFQVAWCFTLRRVALSPGSSKLSPADAALPASSETTPCGAAVAGLARVVALLLQQQLLLLLLLLLLGLCACSVPRPRAGEAGRQSASACACAWR